MGILVLATFVVALATGVETWHWRIIFAAATLTALLFFGPAWVAVPVALIIGIALKNSLDRLKGSSMPKL